MIHTRPVPLWTKGPLDPVATVRSLTDVTPTALRRVEDLDPGDRRRLEEAHRQLRHAVREYVAVAPDPELGIGDAADTPLDVMRRAEAAVQEAEARLWELRARLLGWHRRPTDLSALQARDWFDEEVDYDP